ncbi:MAG: hypothetical protein ACOYXC_03555 [Candidatus Rifleibacteriota bacterium]
MLYCLKTQRFFLFFVAVFSFSFIFSGLQVKAGTQWINDEQMKFKIQIPDNYQKNRLVEGTDVVHVFLSPDQNVAVRIRAIKVGSGTMINNVIQAFEQNVIVGAQKLLEDNYTLNKIPGRICGYKWRFNNTPVGLAVFGTIIDNIAYIVWSIVPEQMFKQRTTETDAIINTFTILKTANNKASEKETVKSLAKTFPKNQPKTDKTNVQSGESRFFDLVSEDAGLSHKVPTGFKITDRQDGQAIWKNEAGIKMVIQTVTRQGELKTYMDSLLAEIKNNGAIVESNVFTVENGLKVANYAYRYGDSYFAYGATTGNDVFYLVGFVGKIADKEILNTFSEEANMSLKKSK